MCDVKIPPTLKDSSVTSASVKKPYSRPHLTAYGNLGTLTQTAGAKSPNSDNPSKGEGGKTH
jgi:hypothetical protein